MVYLEQSSQSTDLDVVPEPSAFSVSSHGYLNRILGAIGGFDDTVDDHTLADLILATSMVAMMGLVAMAGAMAT